MKYLNLTLFALLINVAAHAQFLASIVGITNICSGLNTTYADATTGGTWSCTPTAVGTIVPSTGQFFPLSAGTATISYTVSTGSVTLDVTVRDSPLPVTGSTSVCIDGSTTLSCATLGGTWASTNTAVMTVSGTGVVTAVAGGTSMIEYIMPDACATSLTLTTAPLPATYVIVGGGSACAGGTGVHVSLDGSSSGVNYQLYNGSAAVGSATSGTGSALDFGLMTVAGIYAATATNIATGCISNMMGTATITLLPAPTAYSVVGTSSCGAGTDILLSGSDPGVNYQLVNGTTPVGAPMAGTGGPLDFGLQTVIGTYTVIANDATTACTSTMAGSATISGNKISGNITYSGGSSTDVFKVWLIQYNPADSIISAEDSTTTCMASGNPYYEFDSKPAGSYMVKAALNGAVPGASGYIPTYSLSAPHWDIATTAAHTTGADVMPITMIYGTVPSGPGFISGNVVAGAGRNTADDPVPGMLIYLKDASGNTLTYTYTDASGNYSFPSLANGSYSLYPEVYKYYTTSAVISLGTSSESATGIDFKQHTSYGTITPHIPITGVKQVTVANTISIYPNPASSALNIGWNDVPTGTAIAVITDITGRIVYNTIVNIATTTGNAQIDISTLSDGVYLVAIRSAAINYNGKIAVQK